jgi:hypothetical protein
VPAILRHDPRAVEMSEALVASRWWIAGSFVLGSHMLAGCMQTSQVPDNVSTTALAQKRKAVALMRVGSASPACNHVAVLLGTRDGEGYRRGQVIKVANERSLSEVAVAEVELEPGEHHVIGYACNNERGTKTVMDKADAQTYRTSYAVFTVKPGEVVNVGYLHFGASHMGRSAFGRPLRIDVSVTDWPLNEIDRFKARRPALFAQMTTRLMTVTDRGPQSPTGDDCQRMRELLASGKMQTLPASCAATKPAVANPQKPRGT